MRLVIAIASGVLTFKNEDENRKPFLRMAIDHPKSGGVFRKLEAAPGRIVVCSFETGLLLSLREECAN